MNDIPRITHYRQANLPKSGEGTEDPETQDLWLEAFQRSDVNSPTAPEKRTTERSGNTNWTHNSRVSGLFEQAWTCTASRVTARSSERPRFPREDTRASAHRLSILSCYRFKLVSSALWPARSRWPIVSACASLQSDSLLQDSRVCAHKPEPNTATRWASEPNNFVLRGQLTVWT